MIFSPFIWIFQTRFQNALIWRKDILNFLPYTFWTCTLYTIQNYQKKNRIKTASSVWSRCSKNVRFFFVYEFVQYARFVLRQLHIDHVKFLGSSWMLLHRPQCHPLLCLLTSHRLSTFSFNYRVKQGERACFRIVNFF